MKLLLTSAGITNKSIANALSAMVEEIRIAFIPTAANIEPDEKNWLIDNLVECQKLGPTDIVDISALTREQWLPRLQKATVLVFGGGNTIHLIEWIHKSGLADELPKLLTTRVYVGISAGSIATNGTIATTSDILYEEVEVPPKDGLGLVDFYVAPHLNSPYFPKAREDIIKQVASKIPGDLYALDDDSAISVIDGKISVISEGNWLLESSK